jgi:hypothetical protein
MDAVNGGKTVENGALPTAGALALLMTFCLCAQAGAELLLSLDARQPGNSPTTQWEDISGVNQPFASNGNPVHSAGSGIYSFSRNGLFTGNATDESVFDFDTDQGSGATPFTVVFYAGINGNQGKAGMINKAVDSPNVGWHTGLSQDKFALNNIHSELRTSDNNNRTIVRTPGSAADPFPNTLSAIGVTATALNLYVVHFSGAGQGAGAADVYINGDTSPAAEVVYSFTMLSGASILNDAPLRIGGSTDHVSSSDGFAGTIQFIEIWSGSTAKGMSPADYSAWRFASLGLVLGIPQISPPTLRTVFSFGLLTEEDVMYRLESTTGLAAGPWTDTGVRVLGNGDTLTFFDPAATSEQKAYRVGLE